MQNEQQTQNPEQMQGGIQPQQASPQEQELYDTFVGLALNTVYEKSIMESIVQGIAPEDPASSLAMFTHSILERTYSAASEAGQQIPVEIVLNGVLEILQSVAEVSEKGGAHAFTDEELEAAFYQVAQRTGQDMQKRGQIDEGAVNADWAALEQMEQSGELQNLIGGGAPIQEQRGNGLGAAGGRQ